MEDFQIEAGHDEARQATGSTARQATTDTIATVRKLREWKMRRPAAPASTRMVAIPRGVATAVTKARRQMIA